MIPFPYLSAHPTGSRYTTSPATLSTDDDWLVLVEDLDVFLGRMVLDHPDFVPSMSGADLQYRMEEGDWRFVSYRKGDLNLIVTDDQTMYLRSVASTLLAQKLNLQTKEERIGLFRAIKFGQKYEGRLP